MKIKRNYCRVSVLALIGLAVSLLAPSLWAACTYTNSTNLGELNFTLPPITIPQDTAVGTVLYSGQMTSAQVRVKCTANGEIYQGYTAGITAADSVPDNPLGGVYATNVPGIGVRATWTNSGTASFSSGNYITPWHIGSAKVTNGGIYNLTFNALLELVVTGPIESGTLNASRLYADWKYDDLMVASLRFTSTSVNVMAATCNLVEKNILVPLATVHPSDFIFDAVSGVSDKNFKIQLTDCSPGVAVSFRLTSAGSTGVTDDYTLNIMPGDNAAKGVGIRIANSNYEILKFDKEYTLVSKTTEGQSITMPLRASYVKIGDLRPGEVNAIATFEINYR